MVRLLGLLHLASRFTYQTCVSDGYPDRLRMLPEARAKGEKDLCPRAPNCKIFFITTHRVLSLIMALRWVDSDQPYLPKSKLDNQRYVCFDRHAIAVTTIGDDRNKSFYLPRKHPSIYNTKDFFFTHLLRPIIILCSHLQRDNMQHVCFDRH